MAKDLKLGAVEVSESSCDSSRIEDHSDQGKDTPRSWRKLGGATLHYHPLSRVSKRLKIPLSLLTHAILGEGTVVSPKKECFEVKKDSKPEEGTYKTFLNPLTMSVTPALEDSTGEENLSEMDDSSEMGDNKVEPSDENFFAYDKKISQELGYTMLKWYEHLSRGRCDELLYMLKENPNLLRYKGKGNVTVLHKAVYHSHWELVDYVMNEIFYDKQIVSIHLGNQLTLEDLLCEKDDRGITAVILAGMIGNRDIVDILHKHIKMLDIYHRTLEEQDSIKCQTNCSGIAHERFGLSDQERLYGLHMMRLRNDPALKLEEERFEEAKEKGLQHFVSIENYTGWGLERNKKDGRNKPSQYHNVIVPIVKGILDEDDDCDVKKMKKAFYKRDDYNCVPIEEVFFHFLCGCCKIYTEFVDLRQVRWNLSAAQVAYKIVEKILAHSDAPNLMYDLFDYLDPQGRTPLHVATLAGYEVHKKSKLSCKIIAQILELIPKEKEYNRCVNVRDGGGHTIFHQACILKDFENWYLIVADGRVDFNARVDLYARYGKAWENVDHYETIGWNLNQRLYFEEANLIGKKIHDLLHWRLPGFQHKSIETWLEDFPIEEREKERPYFYPTGLHLLILQGRDDLVERLLKVKDGHIDVNAPLWRGSLKIKLTPLQLAAAMGHNKLVNMLLQHKEVKDNGKLQGQCNELDQYSVLHVAAAYKRLKVLLTLLQNKEIYDPMITLKTSGEQESPLHLVARTRKLPDPIMLEDILLEGDTDTLRRCLDKYKDLGNESLQKNYDANDIVCINIMLQVGFDIWSGNKDGREPYPGDDASIEAYKWWYKRVAAETLNHKQKLNGTMVVITLIAILVAISSLIWPLHPPLGYDSIDGYIQSSYALMRIYFICNSLSFYFAVASILTTITPAMIPMLKESIQDEIRRSQRRNNIAIKLLLISIISIVIGFFCGSIMVMRPFHGYDRKIMFYT